MPQTRPHPAKPVARAIPPEDWPSFLDTFNGQHQGWLAHLETHDRVTGEDVASHEMPLQSIELDLEDEKHPRVNVTVESGNKVIKHILYLPSELVLSSPDRAGSVSLSVATVNTKTTVHLRPPAG